MLPLTWDQGPRAAAKACLEDGKGWGDGGWGALETAEDEEENLHKNK